MTLVETYHENPLVVIGDGTVLHVYKEGRVEGRGAGSTLCGRRTNGLYLATYKDARDMRRCPRCAQSVTEGMDVGVNGSLDL